LNCCDMLSFEGGDNMKLNPDCIRDILLTVEENVTLKRAIRIPFGNTYLLLEKYPHDVVSYHIRQCQLSGLLYNVRPSTGGSFYIDDLSPAGHDFLSNIRADKNWDKAKSAAKKVGTESLSILVKLAGDIIWNLISKP